MTLEKNIFRQVMGHFATGIAVVTTNDHGILAGLTINAFCSVSLEPALVLICVDLASSALPHIRTSGVFAINILTSGQEALSHGFAIHSRERYEEFCYANHHVVATGSPVIDNALAFLDTRVVGEYPGGDHAIFLSQVEAVGAKGLIECAEKKDGLSGGVYDDSQEQGGGSISPLIYFCGRYRHLGDVLREEDHGANFEGIGKRRRGITLRAPTS